MTTGTGYGPTRKTRKSAQREADLWNDSGSGDTYTYAARPDTRGWDGQVIKNPAYTERIVAEVQEVDGGYACAYLTTRHYAEDHNYHEIVDGGMYRRVCDECGYASIRYFPQIGA